MGDPAGRPWMRGEAAERPSGACGERRGKEGAREEARKLVFLPRDLPAAVAPRSGRRVRFPRPGCRRAGVKREATGWAAHGTRHRGVSPARPPALGIAGTAPGMGPRGPQTSPGRSAGMEAAERQSLPWVLEGSPLGGDGAAVAARSQTLAPLFGRLLNTDFLRVTFTRRTWMRWLDVSREHQPCRTPRTAACPPQPRSVCRSLAPHAAGAGPRLASPAPGGSRLGTSIPVLSRIHSQVRLCRRRLSSPPVRPHRLHTARSLCPARAALPDLQTKPSALYIHSLDVVKQQKPGEEERRAPVAGQGEGLAARAPVGPVLLRAIPRDRFRPGGLAASPGCPSHAGVLVWRCPAGGPGPCPQPVPCPAA